MVLLFVYTALLKFAKL